MKSYHWPAHWEIFWYFHSCVEILFLVKNLAEPSRQLSFWNNQIFWPTFYSQDLVQTGEEEQQKACTWLSSQIVFFPLQWIQEFKSLAFHHSNSVCLLSGVPYFLFSLRFSLYSKSIFLIIYIWNCFNVHLFSRNRELIAKFIDF